MSGKLLLFGGTTEGREILDYGIPAVCCVATAYGAETLAGIKNTETLVGKLDAKAIAALIKERQFACVIDATHPYAVDATANIGRACVETATPLRRVLRASVSYGDSIIVSSCLEAASALKEYPGLVLLTTGSKDLASFTAVKDFSERIFVRMLPDVEAVARAVGLGFKKEQIITAQGPFSAEENEEILLRTGAKVIVTKDGGVPGGIKEKLSAAARLGVKVIVVARPDDAGSTVKEAVFWARRIMGITRPPFFPMCVDIEKEKAVVIGGGRVALRRAGILKRCGAEVMVVAPRLLPEFASGGYKLINRPYCPGDLEGMKIAVVATDDSVVNRLAEAEAKEKGIAVNVADMAENCDFFFPAVAEEQGVMVSVSSAGLSPSLTKIVSEKLQVALPSITAAAKADRAKGSETQ